jgi:tetratricopeptide (TPR) repeat protein
MKPIILSIVIFLFAMVVIKPISAQDMGSDLKKAKQLSEIKNYLDAIKLFEEWMPTIKREFEKDQDYISLINMLGKWYILNNQPDSALSILIEAADLSKKLFGEISPEYATGLEALASLHETKREYEKAESEFLKVLEIRKQTVGEEHLDYANSLNKLGQCYISLGNNEKAEINFLKELDIRKKVQGESHPDYNHCSIDLALLYFKTEKYEKAEQLLFAFIEKIKSVSEENNPMYTTFFEMLGLAYMKLGNYEKAESLYVRLLEITKPTLSEAPEKYATRLFTLGDIYKNMGKDDKVESYYLQALEIQKHVLEEANPNYIKTLDNLATLYYNEGNFEKAEPLFEQVLETKKRTIGEMNPDYAPSLRNLALTYDAMDQFEKSEPLMVQAADIFIKTSGKANAEYIKTLEELAKIYRKRWKIEKATSIYLQLVDINKQKFGENSFDIITSIRELAGLYGEIGRPDLAETELLKALELGKQKQDSFDCYLCLRDLGTVYSNLGKYDKAEESFLQASKYWDFTEYNTYDVMVLMPLSELYLEMGKYEQAEKTLLEPLEFIKGIFGEFSNNYSSHFRNIGIFYEEMGNNEKAEIFYRKALDIDEKNPSTALDYHQLGRLYQRLGNYEKAETNLLKAKEIYKQSISEDNANYATTIRCLGDLYSLTGNYEKAEQYLLEAIEIKKRVLGEENPEYGTCLYSLGQLYFKIYRYDLAEPYYLKDFEIIKHSLGESSPDYFTSLNNLAFFYLFSDNLEKAEPLMIKANNLLLDHFRTQYNFLSENEREKYFDMFSSYFENYYLFTTKRGISNPTVIELPINNILAVKGASLQTSTNMQKTILDSQDSLLISKYQLWVSVREEINNLSNLPVNKRYASIDSLYNLTNSLEKELLRGSKDLSESNASINITANDVRLKLNPDEAAIEFVNYKIESKITYSALIIRPNGYSIIGLCNEPDLYKVICLDDISEERHYQKEMTIEELQEIYRLVWQPIEESLEGIKTVYISTSGLLSTIPFQALSPDGKTALMDKMDIRYLMTTRDAGSKDGKNSQLAQTAALFGGIQYDIEPEQLALLEASAEGFASRAILPRDGDRSFASFKLLPGTAKEVASIGQTLSASNWKTTLYTGQDATELRFKKLSGENAPAVIHIATHGFYYPAPEKKQNEMMMISFGKDNAYRLSDNPLRRTGLALAGANIAWRGDELPAGIEDGILTAYEISNMDLRKTQMVVLSACQTGLGDIKAGEGVFGLQRAFRMAGVRTIIMSLWNVDDTTTAELMELFFDNLSKQQTRRAAFDNAMKTVRDRYPEEPQKWAAFVMVE